MDALRAELLVVGDVGSGKTTLIKNILTYLGCKDLKQTDSNMIVPVTIDGKERESNNDKQATLSLEHLARSATVILFIYKSTSSDSYKTIMDVSHSLMATHKESIAYVSTFNDLAGDKVQFTQSDYKFYEVTANSNFDSPAIFVSNAIKDNLSNLKSEYDNPEKKKIKSKCTIL